MAQVLRPHSRPQSRRHSPIPALVVGLVLGSLITYVFVVPFRFVPSSQPNNDSSLSGERNMPQQNLDDPESGWHPVHVFFGKQSALITEAEKQNTFFAQVHQDEVVLDLLGDSGYFIDLAANEAKNFSNTLALEQRGWDGLCVEPNPVYWYGLSHRKCTVVGALVGGKVEQVDVKFRGVYGGIVGKMNEKMANFKREPDAAKEKRYTAPVKDVLEWFRVPKTIDYMSLDVEGAEFLIMQNFPFDEYRIKVLTVERPGKQLIALLKKNGYIFLKDLAWWGEKLWAHESAGFTPYHPKIAKIQTVERNN